MTSACGRRRPRRQAGAVCLALAVSAASCTPTSPSSWAASPFSLLPGAYTLVVYVPQGTSGIQIICVGEPDIPGTASIPVTVAPIASGWQILPAEGANLGFRALVQMVGPTTLYGPVLGQARDPETGVVVTIAPGFDPYSATQGDAMLQGTMSSRVFAAGSVAGTVQFLLDGRARSCTPTRWILHPRSPPAPTSPAALPRRSPARPSAARSAPRSRSRPASARGRPRRSRERSRSPSSDQPGSPLRPR